MTAVPREERIMKCTNIRAAIGGKMQMFCSGPGTISIVRYQIAERKDDRKKQRMSEGKAVSPEGMGRARDTVPTTDDV